MKRVQYIDIGNALEVGNGAAVKPYDHPNDALNRIWVTTSPVMQVYASLTGPVFRTHNTIYRPMDGIEPLYVGRVQFKDYTKSPFKRLNNEVHA